LALGLVEQDSIDPPQHASEEKVEQDRYGVRLRRRGWIGAPGDEEHE
jgi:hypothetical protein